jgi:glycosyl transferase family 25
MSAAFWNEFERIYVINLESRSDRRKEVDEQLRRVGLSLHAPPVRLFRAVRPESPGGFPSIGARGCFLSHLGVLEDACKDKLQSLVILEDDIHFSRDINERIEALTQTMRSSTWSFFYGGYRVSEKPIGSGLPTARPDQAIQTTHFVGVRGQSMINSLVAYMQAQLMRRPGDPLGGPMHVDGTYSWFRRAHPEFVTVLANPEIGRQRASASDIDQRSRLDGYVRSTRLFDAARKLKNRFS